MARQRTLNPQAPMDEDVATMSMAARLLWAYLPCHADREGRLKDSAFVLKCQVFPADNIDVEAVIAELAERKHIIRYEVDGRRFIQIRTFKQHQNPHKNEHASVIPPPPGMAHEIATDELEEEEERPVQQALDLAGLAKLRERSGAAQEKDRSAPADPDLRSGSDPDPDARARTERDPAMWTVFDWRRRYGMVWCDRYGGTAIGGDGAADAKLGDLLESLPRADRLAAQARAPAMFAEFLAEEGEPARARHRWSWFVGRFESLRLPQLPPRPPTAVVSKWGELPG